MWFENEALRTFGSRISEVTNDCTKLHKEMLHNLFPFPNIRMVNSRWMRCIQHALDRTKLLTQIWLQSLKSRLS
jgi:hypothetical protein